MTAAEQLIERGREQGRREMLLDQLRERFGALPDAAVARVSAAGRAELVLAEPFEAIPLVMGVLFGDDAGEAAEKT